MTKDAATRLAALALPCPFCGECLRVKEDHHGYWIGHADEPGPCFFSVAQIDNQTDLDGWNMRDGIHHEVREKP